MGNSQSSLWDKTLKQQYSAPQNVTHSFLGPISLYFHKETNEEIFVKQIEAPSLGSYDEAKYKSRMELDDPGFIKILDINIKKLGSGSCSQGLPRYLFTGIWQFPGGQTLQNVIESKGELWPEYKIWQIASLLIDRCSTLEKISLNHSDLRPKNIFINNDQIIFAEPTAIPGIGSAYKKAMDGDQPYLSPQQIEDLRNFQLVSHSDPIKNDVYSLGMTILNCVTLQSCQQFYDFDTFNIKFVLLKQCFTQMTYSQGLKNFLEFLLTYSENERPTFIQLQKILEPLQNEIKNTKDFFTRKTFLNGKFETISQINVNPLLRSINIQRRQSFVAQLAPETRQVTPTRLNTQPQIITTPVRISRGVTPTKYNNTMRISASPLLIGSKNLVRSSHQTPIRTKTDEIQFVQPTLDQKIHEALKASQKVLDRHQEQQRYPN